MNTHDKYSEYLQTQLNRFAAFIAQSPMNERRVEGIEEMVGQQQKRILELESALKLNNIYLNENMNRMYRKGDIYKEERSEESGFQTSRGREIEKVDSSTGERYEELAEKVADLERIMNKYVMKSKSSSKRVKEDKEVRRGVEIPLIQRRDGYPEFEAMVYQLCRSNCQHFTESILSRQYQDMRKQFERSKMEMKKSLAKKLEKMLKTVHESIGNANKTPSDNYRSILTTSRLLSGGSQNEVIPKEVPSKERKSKRESTTTKVADRLDSRNQINGVREIKGIPEVKQFSCETERNPAEEDKRKKEISRSKSNCSNVSKKGLKSKGKDAKNSIKQKLEKLERMFERGNSKSDRSRREKKEEKGRKKPLKKEPTEKPRKNQSGSRSISQSGSRVKSITPSSSKPNLKPKTKSRITNNLTPKSNTISLISLNSCSRSHSQTSQISKPSKRPNPAPSTSRQPSKKPLKAQKPPGSKRTK